MSGPAKLPVLLLCGLVSLLAGCDRPEKPGPRLTEVPEGLDARQLRERGVSERLLRESALDPPAAERLSREAFLDLLGLRAFNYFWWESAPEHGLTRARAANRDSSERYVVASPAATGYALTALPIGVERGWVGHDEALTRARAALNTLAGGDAADEQGRYFPAAFDFLTARPVKGAGFSAMGTAELLAGALAAESYFRDEALSRQVETLVARVDPALGGAEGFLSTLLAPDPESGLPPALSWYDLRGRIDGQGRERFEQLTAAALAWPEFSGEAAAFYRLGEALPLAPQHALQVLRKRYTLHHPSWGKYGLPDRISTDEVVGVHEGRFLLGIENRRTGLPWKLFMQNPRVESLVRRLDRSRRLVTTDFGGPVDLARDGTWRFRFGTGDLSMPNLDEGLWEKVMVPAVGEAAATLRGSEASAWYRVTFGLDGDRMTRWRLFGRPLWLTVGGAAGVEAHVNGWPVSQVEGPGWRAVVPLARLHPGRNVVALHLLPGRIRAGPTEVKLGPAYAMP